MCLFSKTRIPKIAIKDIKVYKVVKQEDKELVTPYLNYKVSKIMKTSFKECIKAILNMRRNPYNEYEISYGFIHSCTSFLDAQFIRISFKCHNYSDFDKYKIITGIIPKGSLYYENKGDCCSNKLILDL